MTETIEKSVETYRDAFDEYITAVRESGYTEMKSFGTYLGENYPQFVDDYKAEQEREAREQEEREAWKPSRDELKEAMRGHGMLLIEDVRTDHLNGDSKRVLTTAINAVREYIDERKSNPALSLIMVAESVEGDMERTGYGCGKTTLATVIHNANAGYVYDWRPIGGKTINFMKHGRFFEARELMAIFDKDDYESGRMALNFGNLLIIDDVGREGTLRWEKRDIERQDTERQNRYYNVINTCYQRGIGVVITSNLSSRELAATIGGAAWSRLLEMAPKKYRINMTGIPDMRPILGETEWF